jgi:hypothetical protein
VKKYEIYKSDYKNKTHWESIRAMAEDEQVKQVVDYYTVYKYCSSLVHANPLAQLNYFIESTDDTDLLRVFWTSLWYSFRIIETSNDIFRFGRDQTLNEIGQMIEDYGKSYVLKLEDDKSS